MKKTFFILCCIIGSIALTAFTNVEDPFAALLKKLEEFAKKYPTEKVHLHIDKPHYAAGEDIWFKAYVVDSKTAETTTLSKILYVDLIDHNNELKKQLKLQLVNGTAWGDFKLVDTLQEGNYRIRAYTQWMRNAGPAYFFDQTVEIGNSSISKVITKSTNQFTQEGKNEKVNTLIQFTDEKGKPYINSEVSYNIDLGSKNTIKGKTKSNDKGEISLLFVNENPGSSALIYTSILLLTKEKINKVISIRNTPETAVQFFPEGGDLIEDLPTRIAIKAVNSTGNGEDVKGIIVDEGGATITNFQTSHLGMGSFSLNPMKGKTYKAKITFKNGKEKLLELPKVLQSGYILNVNTIDTVNLIGKIYISDDLVGKGDLQLLAQQNGKIYFSVKVPTAKNFAVVNLPKNEFPSGIITITLFNSLNLPVAERLAFINNPFDKITFDITGLENTYGKKGNVKLDVTPKNETDPAIGSFSVAVINESVVGDDEYNETNIFTNLLLKSELKGYIEKPNYYFLNNDLKTKIGTDLLLLTQGWRKMDWKKLMTEPFPTVKFSPEDDQLNISGVAKNAAGKPVPNANVTLLSLAKEPISALTVANAQGKFSFESLTFLDNTRFLISAASEKGAKLTVELDQEKNELITNHIVNTAIQDEDQKLQVYLNSNKTYIEEINKNGLKNTIMLKEVEITEAKKQRVNFTSLGKADKVVTAKDLKNVNNLIDIIPRIGGLFYEEGAVYSRSNSTGAGARRTSVSSGDSPGMMIILDGVYQSGNFDIKSLNPSDVEKIEVLTSPSNLTIYGSRGAKGMLSITTKNGLTNYDDDDQAPKSPNTFSPKGYAVNRQFYEPRYDVNPSLKPDLRTTVYWNPTVSQNEDGKFKLDYFNTDQPGSYRIVIEGIDGNGNLGRKTITYQIK